MKRTLTILCALAFVGAVLTGCPKKKEEPAKTEPAAATTEEKKEEPKKEEPKKEEPKKDEAKAAGGDADKVGIKECDEYISKYKACVGGKVPEASRAAMEKGLETMVKTWKQAAATEAGKKAMATGCAKALEMAKKTMAAYKCEW